MQVNRAIQQQGGLWEVIAGVGKDKQEHTALHSILVLADQMNVRAGATLKPVPGKSIASCWVLNIQARMRPA